MAQCRVSTPRGSRLTTDYKAHRRRFCRALKIEDSGRGFRFVVIFKYKSMVYAFLVFSLTVVKPTLSYMKSFSERRGWYDDLFLGNEIMLRLACC